MSFRYGAHTSISLQFQHCAMSGIRSVKVLDAKDDYQRAVMEPTQMHDSKWICWARLKFGMARLVLPLSCEVVRVDPPPRPNSLSGTVELC